MGVIISLDEYRCKRFQQAVDADDLIAMARLRRNPYVNWDVVAAAWPLASVSRFPLLSKRFSASGEGSEHRS